MKLNIWILVVISLLLSASCTNKKRHYNITPRNYSITAQNAYNDLFLDSSFLVNFIRENNIPEDTARRMTSFYNARNFEYAWFSPKGFSEQALGLISLLHLHPDTTAQEKQLLERLNALKLENSINPGKNSSRFHKLELLLTWNFVEYMLNRFENETHATKFMEYMVPAVKMAPLVYADSLLNPNNKEIHFSDKNESFKLLLHQLEQYVALAGSDEWKAIPKKEKMPQPGMAHSIVPMIKNNLYLLGDLNTPDSSDLYNDSMIIAVKHFQARHGMHQDGIIGPEMIALLNISPVDHVKKILINMNRMKWLPSIPVGQLIIVNIPAFMLHAFQNNEINFSMPVIVGEEGHSTVLFADKMTNIVFSPYWNVPQSIVKNEILPAMDTNKHYLEEKHMEITGARNGYPVIRQLPGPWNSLGGVKFLFPNSFNIYLHDTPAKYLFNKEDRAFSHGCIRVADPVHLAQWLLQGRAQWDAAKIKAAMSGKAPQWVALEKPASIIITYYTAWVNQSGVLELREDIYGHDEAEAKRLFR